MLEPSADAQSYGSQAGMTWTELGKGNSALPMGVTSAHVAGYVCATWFWKSHLLSASRFRIETRAQYRVMSRWIILLAPHAPVCARLFKMLVLPQMLLVVSHAPALTQIGASVARKGMPTLSLLMMGRYDF